MKKSMSPIDELKLGVSTLSLAIVQAIQKSDKTIVDRLIPRIETDLQVALKDHPPRTQVAGLLAAFLSGLKNPENFAP